MKVFLIAASTICGRISPVGMGSREDRFFLETIRSKTDASLLGAGSLRDSDPEMRVLANKLPGNRIRSIITASGNIPVQNKKIFHDGPAPVIFTSSAACANLRKILHKKTNIIEIPFDTDQQLSIKQALLHLEKLGAKTVLIEGGGYLNFTALHQQAVDEIFLTLTPFIIGSRNESNLADGPYQLGKPYLPLQLLSSNQSASGELFLHYKVKKENTHE